MSVDTLNLEMVLEARAQGQSQLEEMSRLLGDNASVMHRLTTVAEEMTAAMRGVMDEVRALSASMVKLDETTTATAGAVGKLDASLAANKAGLAAHSKATETSGASLQAFGDKAKLVTAAVAVGLGVGIFEAAKKAAAFQQQMTLLHTQAGAWNEDLNSMGKAVLDMAGQVGFGAVELAGGLYHIESASFRGAHALDMLTAAAKLAKIGQSNLEDTTQAVIGTMAAFEHRGLTAAQAAGQLNAIVGTGDMRMQQLAMAIATGVLPAADQFGLSLTDVGAALATITDNVTHADEAATRLRMTFALLGAPTGAATKALQAIGIGPDEAQKIEASRHELDKYGIHMTQLAADMHQPNGLLVAVGDLKAHLEGAGLSPAAQSAAISKAFGGGRTSSAIETLVGQYPRFQSKYPAIKGGEGNFDQSWQQTTQTFNVQKDLFDAGFGSMEIRLGQGLLPILSQLLRALNQQIIPAVGKLVETVSPLLARISDWMKSHQQLTSMLVAGALIFAGVVVALMAVGGVVFLVGAALGFLIGPAGIVLGVIALLAAGALLVITHWKQIEPVVKAVTKVWTDHSTQVMAVVRPFLLEVQKLFGQALKEVSRVVGEALKTLAQWWKDHGDDVMTVVRNTWDVIHGILAAVLPIILVLIKISLTELVDIVKLAWSLVVDIIRLAWDIISGILAIALDLMLGHWGKAWNDAKRLVSNVWDDIKRLVGDAIHGVLQLVIDLKDKMPELAGAIGNALRDGIVGGLNQILDKVHGFIDLLRKLPGLGSFPQVPQSLGGGSGTGGVGVPHHMASGGVVGLGAGFRTAGAMAIVGEGDGHEYVIPAGDRRHRQNAIGLWMRAGRDLNMLEGGGVLGDGPIQQMGAGIGALGAAIGSWGGQCVVFAERLLGTYWPVAAAAQLTRYVNSNVAKAGEAAVFTGGPYGHVAVVTGSEGPGGFPVIDSNWVGPEIIGAHVMNRGQYGFRGFIDTGAPLGTLAGLAGLAGQGINFLGGLVDGVLKGFSLNGLPSWLGSFPQEVLKRIAEGAKNDFTPSFGGSSAGATVFDDGGWLMPGRLGYNGSGQPERVLSPRQDDELSEVLADVAAGLNSTIPQRQLLVLERCERLLIQINGGPAANASASSRRSA